MTTGWLSIVLFLLSSCHLVSLAPQSGPRIITRVNHRNETYVLMVQETDTATFLEADARCSVMGSMVWIRDEADQRFVHSLLSAALDGSHKMWLGCQFNQGLLSTKLTITDPLARQSAFENWKKNEPRCSVYGECCAIAMDGQGKWLAFPCTVKAHILCRVKKSFQVEANKMIEDTKNAILANGGTVPPELNTTSHKKDDVQDFNEALSNMTERLTKLEQQIENLSSKFSQMVDEKHGQAFQHSDKHFETLSYKISNMTVDFNGSIDSLTKLLIKKHG